MKRNIITIDNKLCDGCGNCVTSCSEGALQIVNGKAKLVKEDFCDGFGDCIGECPTGALKINEQEVRPFDIKATREYLLKTRGKDAVQRMEAAQKKHEAREKQPLPCGCPGSLTQIIAKTETTASRSEVSIPSRLGNWPVQIHLLPVKAPYYEGVDLLVAADCCAYAYGGFHHDFIQGHTVAIGCPKLDNTSAYKEKLATISRENALNSITVIYMEVPCCLGIVKLVQDAIRESGKKIPVRTVKIGIQGEIVENQAAWRA